MYSIVTITIVLLAIVCICPVLFSLHNKLNEKRAGLLQRGFTKRAIENNLVLSNSEELVNCMVGIDYNKNKLFVCQVPDEYIIDIGLLKSCRIQKKWLHIPVSKENRRSETHLEKIVLAFDFKEQHLPVELVFYEYRYNSIFQMQELEQKAGYWEILINKQMKNHETL